MAVRVLGAGVQRQALARLRQGGPGGRPGRVRGARAQVRGPLMGETGRRVLQAVPAIAFAAFIVVEGGLIFALGLVVLGVICLRELYQMLRRARPIDVAGFAGIAGLCLTALYGQKRQPVLVLVLAGFLCFLLAIVRPRRQDVSWGIAA